MIESCKGKPAHIRPWEPHPICRNCVRRMSLHPKVINPEWLRKPMGFECKSKVTE